KEKVEVEQTSIGFKKVYVFDVSQTSGEPIPEYVHELNEAVEDEQVEAVINAVHDITGLPVDFENIKSGAKGYYSYGEQRIVIQENLSGAQAIKTAIHECAHALLHDHDKKLPTANTSRSDTETATDKKSRGQTAFGTVTKVLQDKAAWSPQSQRTAKPTAY
ncbi:MAG: ImmA/IrrE family metallo-endopeptidase, partial [Eubacteriales bacterium]|nr:ImmA/IrrE family metallo-endopeptidase [Eubacteriales bacterium]